MFMKRFVEFSVLLVVAVACCCCGSMSGGTSNRYVISPVTDTITIRLSGYENELCEVKIYGNNAYFRGTDYVSGGCVKFGIGSLPAGRHRVGIRVGDLVADENFVKR